MQFSDTNIKNPEDYEHVENTNSDQSCSDFLEIKLMLFNLILI